MEVYGDGFQEGENKMKNIKDDWRFQNQDRFLKNKVFIYKKYDEPYPEHSHCEFCWRKFGAGGDIQEGYTSMEDIHDIWICPECFNDFKEMLLNECNCKLVTD